MNTDLIFHVVSRRKWPSLNKDGIYKPEGFMPDKGIECVTPSHLNEYLNKEFKGHKNIYLLVIDVYRLAKRINVNENTDVIYLNFPINLDAVLDKIKLDCNQKGEFDLNVKSFV